jgi:hypothetical protein
MKRVLVLLMLVVGSFGSVGGSPAWAEDDPVIDLPIDAPVPIPNPLPGPPYCCR